MSVRAPHFLLYAQAARAASSASYATGQSAPRTRDVCTAGRWRFVLRLPGGETSLEAADDEEGATPERLELLATVRGLEALDQPSHVTLVGTSHSLQRGLQFGLGQWRESDWHWERFGQMTPVKNGDLWQRLDRLLEIHTVECRPRRPQTADDLAAPPSGHHSARATPRWLRRCRGRLVRIDAAAAKPEIRSPKRKTNAKSKWGNGGNASGSRSVNSRFWNLSRISDFVLRMIARRCIPPALSMNSEIA
jgi:ribonuclease HI